MADQPEEPRTIAAHQAPDFGVPAGTVRYWASIGKLYARGLDKRGRPLYALADVRELAARRAA